MSRVVLALTGTGLAGLLLLLAGTAPAGDPLPDPSDPPVRLKKKEKPDKKAPDAKGKEETVEGKKVSDQPPKEEAKKPARPQPDKAEEERKQLVARVRKNLKEAESRLAKNNPGKGTQDVQRRIQEDLDKLIEETQKQQSSSSCPSGMCKKVSRKKSSSRSSGGKQGSQGSKGSNSSGGAGSQAGRQPNQGGSQQKKKDQGGAAKNQNQGGKKNTQGGKENQPKKQGNQTGQVTGTGGSDKTPRGDRPHMAEVFKDVWGHLPETLRQEMDAYSRAKFVPEYDARLRQYYRKIAEQGHRQKGD